MDFARSAKEEALGAARLDRLECVRQHNGWIEVGIQVDVAVEVCDGTIRSGGRLELDRSDDDVSDHRVLAAVAALGALRNRQLEGERDRMTPNLAFGVSLCIGST